jgi:tetraacyldisaccharide 4'-kinase
VGNITRGGTGKTPLVIAIVELLQERGWNPAWSRAATGASAARARTRGVVRVYPDIATPEHFGDEPVLIARRRACRCNLARPRAAAARALARIRGERVVSDDGLQHYALARDVEIAVVDGERGFGNRLLLPRGRCASRRAAARGRLRWW